MSGHRFNRCAFCQRLDVIDGDTSMSADERDAAVDALFDQADRAARARHVTGRKRGKWSARV